MARDTAIYAVGRLAEILTRTAAAGSACARASARAASEDASARTSLIEVHLEGGIAALHAGDEHDEFVLVCSHRGFELSMVLGFEVGRERLLGIALSEFRGQLLLATRWAFRIIEVLDGHGGIDLGTRVANDLDTSH